MLLQEEILPTIDIHNESGACFYDLANENYDQDEFYADEDLENDCVETDNGDDHGVLLSNKDLDSELFEDFMDIISSYKVCTKEEELSYFKRIKEGDKDSLNEFILRNQRLVVYSVKKYIKSSSFSFMDLIQEGNFGLMKAIDRFDPSLGYKFSTYAVNWITQSVQRSIENKGNVVNLPSYLYRIYMRSCSKAMKDNVENGTPVNWDSVSKYVKEETKSTEALRSIETFYFCKNSKSLDMDIQSEKSFDITVLSELIADPYEGNNPELQIEIKARRDAINKALCSLNEREREVIILRFGLNGKKMTLAEIEPIMGVTRERVRQIEAVALKKLKSWKNRRLLEDFLYS